MKSRGLKARLLLTGFGVGLAITCLLLFAHALVDRRDDRRMGQLGEEAFAAAIDEQLGTALRDTVSGSLGELGNALATDDRQAVERVGDALLADRDIIGVRVEDRSGVAVYDRSQDEPRTAGLAAEDRLELHQQIVAPGGQAGAGTGVGTLTAVAGLPGIGVSGANLRTSLDAVQDEDFDRWFWILTAIGLIATGAAMGLAWVVAARLEHPISELIRTAERIGEGDYSRPLTVSSRNEIAELENALESLRQKLRQTTITTHYLNTVLNSMSDAVLVTSTDGVIRKVNDAGVRLFGFTEDELIGQPLASLIAEQERETFSLDVAASDTRETVILTHNGQTIPVSLSAAPLAADDPQFQGAIFVVRDITDRKRAERRIRYLAQYDALTKVPNRMQFQHMLQQAIARSRRAGRSVVLLYLDMDQFKEINDTFGHAAGDRTLEILSERLTRILPKEAVVGRLAGDEFALFIEELGAGDDEERSQAVTLARQVLTEVGKPFYVQHHELILTASIGISFCPKDAENVIDLIRTADAAMYHSKQNGGNSFAVYTPEMNAAAVERLMLKSKLRRALERDEFVINYQPKVNMRDGTIVGAEALLRWRLPGHGDISPSQFIPLAEETNLILEIGHWVLNRVCSDYRRWQQTVANPGRVSINLSLKQLRTGFIMQCRSVFKEHAVSPTCFELEITETTLMVDAKRTIKLLNELYAMGLHLSIDDFGTGYSSLSALQQFPIGTLKIDQSFVRDVAFDSDDATIVRTIIDMGKSLEMEVVAEGVENAEQFNFLRSRGCHYAQGRLFGDAMSADDFLALIAAQAAGRGRVHQLFGHASRPA